MLIIVGICSATKAQQFNFQSYSIDDGLAQSQVFSMLSDSRGYLWLGTNGGGLSRFDGITFENYSRKDKLPGSYIYALQEDAAGNIWVGTDKGLALFDGLNFRSFSLDPFGIQAISDLAVGTSNGLWIGTTKGLLHYNGKKFSIKNELLPNLTNNSRVNCLFYDSNGSLWVGMDNQVVRIGKSIQSWSYNNGFTGGKVFQITEDLDNNIWLATFRGAYRFDGSSFTRVNTSNGLSSNYIQSIHVDNENKIWLGFQNNGLAIFNPADSVITNLSERDGLTKNDIRCITQDKWKNIWIGTSGGGISKYAGQQFEHFNRTNRLIADRVYAIFQDTSGTFLVSASNQGFSEISDSGYIHHNASTDFIDIPVKALFKDSHGLIWAGTEGKGLAMIDSSGYLLFSENLGLAGNWVKDIIEDDFGFLWVATNDGISKVRVTKDTLGVTLDFKNFDQNNGIPSPSAHDLHLDKTGRIWAALRFGGLLCIDNDTLKYHFQQNNGLPTSTIRSLVEDTTGILWIGTADNGVGMLSIYSDSMDISFLPSEKLYSENVYSLILDEEQNLWVGSQQGVDKVTFTEDRNLKDVKHFGRAEGFAGIENCTNAVWKDPEGNLWFGTMNGLTKYNSNFQNRDTLPPLVRFSNISLEYTPLRQTSYAAIMSNWGQIRDSLVLPWQRNDLTFEFRATDLAAPTGMKYQWQLEGLDDNWGPAVENNIVRFANLSPGNYTFRVKSINRNQIESRVPAEFRFTIKAPFWQKKWFPWVAAPGLLFLISLIFWSRYRQLKRKSEQKQAQLSMEKKMLELEQKALQLQMNPHFIFNTLNSIQGLISQQNPKKARFYLAKFSSLMRLILENSRAESISLENEIKSLDDYLSLEQFGKNNAFDYHIDVSPEIDAEDFFIPPLVIQPFVENAIVHGFSGLQKKGLIQIEFTQQKDCILCTITDNGIGRQAASQQKSQRDSLHKSMGLQVTAERLDLLNENKVESLRIEDIIDKEGNPGGTKIFLKFHIG